jgi:hypothetical protein
MRHPVSTCGSLRSTTALPGPQTAWLCFKLPPKPQRSIHHAVRAKALVALCILARTTAEALAEFA